MNNIKGVDILTSNDVMIPVFKEADICYFCCLIAFMVCLVFLVSAIQLKKKKVAFTFSVLAIIAFSTCIFFVSLDSKEKASGIREYKATISEDASFVEINDRYEVVSQKGKLYTLRDKVTNETDTQKEE